MAPLSGGHRTYYLNLLVDHLLRKQSEIYLLGCKDFEGHFSQITFIPIKYLNPERVTNVHRNWIHVAKVSKRYNIKKVFFFSLDAYVKNYIHPIFVRLIGMPPWTGIFLHPTFMRISDISHSPKITDRDSALRCKTCKGIAIFDEYIKQRFASRIKKDILLIPDLTDIEISNDSTIVNKIENKSKNRIKIGLFGTLEKRKSLIETLQLAKRLDDKQFFFIIVGKKPNYYSSEDEALLKNCARRENVFFRNEFIESESELNAIIESTDIVLLLYKNFYSSSNFLTKAIFLRKWVLSYNYGVICNRVQQYDIGECTEVGIEDIEKAIQKLVEKINYQEYPINKTEEFIRNNSQNKFEEFVGQVCNLYS